MAPDKTPDHEEPGDEVGETRQPGTDPPIVDPEDIVPVDAGENDDKDEDDDDDEGEDEDGDEDDDEDEDDDDDEDESDLDDEALPEAIEEEPRTVLITGACGNIGCKLRTAWADVYDLVLIDEAASPHDPDVIAADLRVLDDDWITHFHGVDTVVHLAANTNELASWDELIGPNLDAMAN